MSLHAIRPCAAAGHRRPASLGLLAVAGPLLFVLARAASAQPDIADSGPPVADLVAPRLPQSQHGHPAYPEDADGQPARVLLEVTIDETGSVVETSVVETDRDGVQAVLFEEAALQFVRDLRFEPATRDGEAVAARIRFEVLFQPREHTHEVRQQVHDGPLSDATQGEEESSEPVPSAGEPIARGTFGASAEVRPPYQATSSVDLQGKKLRLRPHNSAGDLLNAGTGFYVIQHAGGGKANQYFLRGFDADHGTDVALFVDDIPVNQVSHGHGQGYVDLHWVIPELIERMEIRKGPYFARYGDFATAGAVNLVLHEQRSRNTFSFGGGTYRTLRGVTTLSPEVDGFQPLLAAEVYGTDGPFDNDEDLRRFNVFGRAGHRWEGGARLSLTFTSHLSGWHASGQIPLREVRAGRLDRFGSLDPDEGGSTQRHGVYASIHVPTGARAEGAEANPGMRGGERGAFELTSWFTYSRFALYSNFTFFSANPSTGDMIRQGDRRWIGGLRAAYEFYESLGSLRFRTRAGAQTRFDDIRTTLHDAPRRELGNARVNAAVGEGSIGLFAEQEVRWRWLRAVLGARADYFAFAVRDRLEDRLSSGSRSSAEAQDLIVSPKASLIVTPLEPLELFANFGFGFHSNDARGVVRGADAVTPLTGARGYELGARVSLWKRLELSAAAFRLDLDSETVWIGDEGTTEPRGATRRLGLEGQARVRALEWLSLDMDATWTNSTFVDNPSNADSVALAPTFMLDAGAMLRHPRTGLSGRLGAVYVADRPATEDGFLEAEGFYRLDASATWETQRLALALHIQNLTNTEWRQAQFATTSRLADESDASSCPAGTRPVDENGSFVGCEDLHFTPGWPLHLMATATLFF